ncbi:MAG TPA: fumarylacetoacetate hydrolase family protein [Streptosporangiaceae bacterium]|nr:fumarylacetoacetate hydrolase family protein [Streptosporangiaceae bacterium]
MRWVTYVSPADGGERPGLLRNGTVHGLRGTARLLDLLGDDGGRLAQAAENALADPAEVVKEEQARLCAPIPVPPSIRDYMAFEEHTRNARLARGREVDRGWYELPVFYFTNPAAVHGPADDVAISPGSRQFDYELEVAAVIGREGRDLSPGQAEEHIAGYLILCDWSARDVQFAEMKQMLGPVKGKDSATSLGPALVTPDELAPYRRGKAFDLAMTATVNGRPYSEGNLADIYWSFGQMISYASQGTRVVPGDVIGSGTVGTGCILELSGLHGSDSYPWLQPGDQVRLEVAHLGAISARILPGRPVAAPKQAVP